MVPESLDDLVSTADAANRIGVSAATIRSWASRGYLAPTGLDDNARPLYKMIDVLRCARDTRRRAIGQSRIA
jgi:DNA-binding transcriptional MerR regulator